MQTRGEYQRSLGWLSVGTATIAVLVAVLYLFTEGSYLTVALLLGLAGMTGLQAADDLVWRGSQSWLRWVVTTLAVVVVAVACWAVIDQIAS